MNLFFVSLEIPQVHFQHNPLGQLQIIGRIETMADQVENPR